MSFSRGFFDPGIEATSHVLQADSLLLGYQEAPHSSREFIKKKNKLKCNTNIMKYYKSLKQYKIDWSIVY